MEGLKKNRARVLNKVQLSESDQDGSGLQGSDELHLDGSAGSERTGGAAILTVRQKDLSRF